MKQVATATVLALVLGVTAAAATAEDKPGQKHELSAEEKAMLDAWEKAAKPGPQHRWLASKAGILGFTALRAHGELIAVVQTAILAGEP